jgi:hypothetical protein
MKRALRSLVCHIVASIEPSVTLLRFQAPDALFERGVHEFDAWASAFGDTRIELELQPSGAYKAVERFCEFISDQILVCNIISTSDGARDGTKTNIGNSGWRSSPRPQRRERKQRPYQAPHPQAPNRRPRHRSRRLLPSPWHDPRQGTRNPRAREYWPTRTV